MGRLREDPDFDDVFDGEMLLRNGDRGPVIEKLQRALLDVGYALPRFGADGDFGAETESAVRAFQRDSGLTVDGIVGPATIRELDDRLAGSTPGEADDCRTFLPSTSETIVADSIEHPAPPDVQVKNWADEDVLHFSNPGTTEGTFLCRHPLDITELIIHETQTPDFPLSRQRRFDRVRKNSVHFIIHRTGDVTQHNDLVDRLSHASQHNSPSVGIEIVNPFVPRFAHGNLDEWPMIEQTTWGLRDDGRNPDRSYVLPERAQCEALTDLVEWLNESHEHDGGVVWPGIPRTWVGLDEQNRLLFGYESKHNSPSPGIYAHAYFKSPTGGAHADGRFPLLVALLQLEGGLSSDEAYDRAVELATDHVEWHGGRRIIDLDDEL